MTLEIQPPQQIDPETFLPVSGYEGKYEISNYGRLRSKTNSSRHAKTDGVNYPKGSVNEDGYLAYSLTGANRKSKFIFAHVLVAQVFTAKPVSDEKLEVNHKDLNKLNNRYDNLEWITHKQNIIHCIANNGFKDRSNEKNANCKLSNQDVKDIRELRLSGKTLQAIADKYGITNGHVYRLCAGYQRKL